MKLFLHKIVTLLIGISFLSAYFEFNEAEKKQNYEKESHACVISVKQAEGHSIKQPEKFIASEFLCELSVKCLYSCEKKNVKLYSPPQLTENKLFLRHSVFLI